MMTPQEQFQVLNMLDYLSDLFTAAEKETFTRTDVLIVLNATRNDPDFIAPAVLVAQQEATQE